MSLQRAMRNARRAINYGIGMSTRDMQRGICAGVSFDLTTDEGCEATAQHAAQYPGPVIPDDWDGSKISVGQGKPHHGETFENLMEKP